MRNFGLAAMAALAFCMTVGAASVGMVTMAVNGTV
jgi:hypothetical protein